MIQVLRLGNCSVEMRNTSDDDAEKRKSPTFEFVIVSKHVIRMCKDVVKDVLSLGMPSLER